MSGPKSSAEALVWIREAVAASRYLTDPHFEQQARKRRFDEFFDEQDGRENRLLGVQLCLDVALPYLEEGRLDKADEVFARLERIDKEPAYLTLGRLGRGTVLALRERPDESNALFKKVQRKPGDGSFRRVGELIFTNRTLAKWLAEAVHHNLTNGLNQKDLPPYLQRYVRRDGR